jgi:multiple sugar transport system ATP-binding protein
MAELRLANLSKVFPGQSKVHAVQELSLSVNSGECVALLGPSGAGKSTVLRLIAGLEAPTTGQILINGHAVESMDEAARDVAMAFQYPALLPQLSVEENLRLGLKLRKLKESDERVELMARLLGIGSLMRRRPETLSGGEQQRVALGRALITKPRVVLLDEPLASLDPVARLELRDVIRRVQTELALTMVYVTHDQTEAAAVADRIALLREGMLQQFGTARELYLNPRNLFVAQFFGIDGINLLKARILTEQNQWFSDVQGARFPLSGRPAGGIDRELFIGFRPSVTRLLRNSGAAWIVKEVRDLGWRTELRLGLGSNEITAHQQPTAAWRAGEVVDLQIDPESVFLFDPLNGERLL